MATLKSDGKAVLAAFIGVMIVATLLISISNQVVGITSTGNESVTEVTTPAVNGTVDLVGRELLATTSITLANGTDVNNLGVHLQTGTGTNGLRTVQIVVNDTGSSYASTAVNVSYTYNPDGYISNSAGRSMTNLIIIVSAIALLIFVIYEFVKNGTLGSIINGRLGR